MASPTAYLSFASLSPRPSAPTDMERSNPNGLPNGCGIPMLSFLTLFASFSFSLVFGSRIAVRILLPLALREWDGVLGGSSRFLEKLSLRVCGCSTGLVDAGLSGGSSIDVSVGETGEVTGVDDAMVPPTPMREVTGMIFNGAFRVMGHDVGGIVATGVTSAGLCGEPMAITKGMLELDAALTFRSGDDGGWIEALVMAELADPARGRSIAGDVREEELSILSSIPASGSAGGALDAFELLSDSEPCIAVSWHGVYPGASVEFLARVCTGLKIAVRLDRGESKRPYRGRAGRSGVILPLFDSDTDAEQAKPRVLNM